MRNLQNFIDTEPIKVSQTSTLSQKKTVIEKAKDIPIAADTVKGKSIKELVYQAKEENADIIELLKNSDIQIVEVAI